MHAVKKLKSILRYLPAIFLLLLFFCNPPPKDADGNSKPELSSRPDSTVNESDSAGIFPPRRKSFNIEGDTVWNDSLQKYFTSDEIVILKQAHAEYENISRESDLAIFYNSTIHGVCEIITKQLAINEPAEGNPFPDEKWRWLFEYMPCLTVELLCMDCSYVSVIDTRKLLELAKTTPEPEDDLFFELVVMVHPKVLTKLQWLEYTSGLYTVSGCDLCEASTLGDGRRTQILSKIIAAAPSRKWFDYEMDELLESIIRINRSDYLYSKEKVLAEIADMLESPLLNQEQKSQINEEIVQLTKDADFGCADLNRECW